MEKKIESIDNDGNVTSVGMNNYDDMSSYDFNNSIEETNNYDDMTYNNNNEINEEYDVFGNSPEPKKKFNKKLLLIPLAILIIVIIGIFIFIQSGNKYTLKTKTITIKIDEESQIEIVADEKVKEKITFSSENDKIAKVDKDGTVTGVEIGNTTIYVGINGKKSNKVNVKVETNKEELVFEESNVVIEKDGSYQLKIKNVLDTDLFTWTSNNEDVATVDPYGLVTGVHAGQTTITVKESDGRKASARVTVTSNEILIEKISLTEQTIAIGEKLTLSPSINPTNALKILTWSSNRKDVVDVDENGVITGIKAGTATITVTSHNGKKATAKITVDEKLPASININGCNGGLAIGTPIELDVEILPETAASSSVTWKSSNTDIATVSKGKVTGKNPGKVTITAETKNGKKATCNLTVSPTAITKLTANPTSFNLDQGATKKISINFTPSSAKEFYTLSWKSSNSKIATVNSEGLVTGVNPGKATITASAGGKSVQVSVTVNATAVTSVQIVGCQNTLEVDNTLELTANTLPATAKDTSITWTSSDTNKATVYKGKVTAKDIGAVTITAKSKNGKTATCQITITKPSVANLKLSTGNTTLTVNGTKTITATTNLTTTKFNKYYVLEWTSSDPSVVSVTPNSKNSLSATIKGLKTGAATIYARVGTELISFGVVVS